MCYKIFTIKLATLNKTLMLATSSSGTIPRFCTMNTVYYEEYLIELINRYPNSLLYRKLVKK